jgi:AraC-like DNA-binding protein
MMDRAARGGVEASLFGRPAPAVDARPWASRAEHPDLESYAHHDTPPGYEMTTTGPATGPYVLHRARFDRAAVQFGLECGPNIGHAAIPDFVVVFHVTTGGPPPLTNGTPLTRTRMAVIGPGTDQIEAVRGAGRWATFATTPDLARGVEASLGLRNPTFEPGRVRVVTMPRAAADALRMTLAETYRRIAESPRDFDDEDVRTRTHRELSERFVAAAAGRPVAPPAGLAAQDHERILLACMRVLGARPLDVVTIADLCCAADTSQRTLTRVFHESFDVSPARYLRLRRLNQVRAHLRRAAPPPASVTAAATRFGFFELGRFAGEYRRLFGELPSDTLRKRTAG